MQVPQNVIEGFRELIISNSDDLSKEEEQFILNYLVYMTNMNYGQTHGYRHSNVNDTSFIVIQIQLLSNIYHHSLKTNC